MCMSFIEGKMDQILIENGNFEANIEHFKLFEDVIRPIFDLFYQ